MHLVTGMVVAALMGKRVRGRSLLPVGRTGPVRIVHTLPGRTRFRIPDLGERGADASVIESRLGGVEGVARAWVDPVSGSVLVRHDERKVGPTLLFAAVVRLIGADDELKRPPSPVLQRELRQVCEALNRSVYDWTGGIVDLKTALLIVFMTLGLRKILRNRSAMLPAGLSLVWWAANGLLRETGG